MIREEIKQTILDFKSVEEGYLSSFYLKVRLRKNLKTIVDKKKKIKNSSCNEDRWIIENTPLLLRFGKTAEWKKTKIKKSTYHLAQKIIELEKFSGLREEIETFYSEINRIDSFSETELFSFRNCFICIIIEKIAEKIRSNNFDFIRYFQLYHKLNAVDFSAFSYAYSPIEKILREDYSKTYSLMTRQSQHLYRFFLEKESKKRRLPLEALCKEKIQLSKENKTHLGFFIFPKRSGFLYFTSKLFLFTFLSSGIYFLLHSLPLVICLSLPVFFFSKRFLDFVFSFFIKSYPLPEMKIDKITEKEKTCVVIVSLILSTKDIDDLIEKIKCYAINNYSENEAISFGLLCDFGESTTPFLENDVILKNHLTEKINELNRENCIFFAYLRKRKYHKSENKYVGWERKRGAIENWIDFITNGIQADAFFVGEYKQAIGSSYLIVLDTDTRISIGQVRRLVGIACHPLHTPVIENKNGNLLVTSGYGILQPKISSSLLEKIQTPFGKIIGNGSGNLPYATASYDPMQTFFGEGNFCGKGLIDVQAYGKVIKNKFSEQTILSHDMPEGAFLRCGLVSNEFFSDSNPQTITSFYKRQHRWIRGDVQNIILFSKLPFVRRILAIENLLSYLVPLSNALALFISFRIGNLYSIVCALTVILFSFDHVLFTVFGLLANKNASHFRRRFSTRMRNLLLNAVYNGIINLSSIAFEAYYFTDAFLRGLHRCLITKKHLLQWQVFSPLSTKHDNGLLYLPSLVIGVLFLLFAFDPITCLIPLLWILFPSVAKLLSKPYSEKMQWNSKEKALMIEMARKEFSFFEYFVNEKTSYLPPDNIQTEPLEKIALRTSPTNIGLYLAVLICGHDLGFIKTEELITRLEKSLEKIETLERWNGHLYNWYDLNTLCKIGDDFVSTVDSGNYFACIVVVVQALKKIIGKDPRIPNLIAILEKEIEAADFSKLLNVEKNVLSVGIYPESQSENGQNYDLYMSEARITAFLGIGLGKLKDSVWKSFNLPLLTYQGRMGIGSWSGTAFEFFMAPLFIPVIENSLEDESLDFALFCQKKYSSFINFKEKIFGISESGYSLTDFHGNYQYKAFGVPYLSIQDGKDFPKVISPYSSFLMLNRKDRDLLKNLQRMEKNGLCGTFGYYEAKEFYSNFLNDSSTIYSYMSHHKGMSLLALTNAISDQAVQKYFMSYRNIASKIELLTQRFPIEGKVFHKNRSVISIPTIQKIEMKKAFKMNSKNKQSHLVTDGKLSIITYDDGENRFLHKNTDLFDFHKGGLKIRVFLGEKEYCFFCNSSDKNTISFENNGFEYSVLEKKISIIIRIELLNGKNAFLVRFEINGYYGPVKIITAFHPILQNEKEFFAHPAFHSLSLEVSKREKVFRIRRRGIHTHRYLYLCFTDSFRVNCYGENDGAEYEDRAMIENNVETEITFNNGKSIRSAIVFALTDEDKELDSLSFLDGSLFPCKELRRRALEQNLRFLNSWKYDSLCEKTENSILCALRRNRRILFDRKLKGYSLNQLWKFGISGDYPLVVFPVNKNDDLKLLSAAIRVFKKFYVSGISAELVIVLFSKRGYFDDLKERVTSLITAQSCEYLIGKPCGIHFVTPEQSEDYEVLSDCAVCLVGNENSQKEEITERELEIVALKHEMNSVPSEIAVLNHEKISIQKTVCNPKVPFSHVISNRMCGFVCDQNSLGFTWFRNSSQNRISKWENQPTNESGEKILLKYQNQIYDLIQTADHVSYQNGCVVYRGEIQNNFFQIISTVSDQLSSKMIYTELDDAFVDDGEIIFSFIPVLGNVPNHNIRIFKDSHTFVMTPVISSDYSCGAFFYPQNNTSDCFRFGERLCFSLRPKKDNLFFLGGFSGSFHLKYLKNSLNSVSPENLLTKTKQSFHAFFTNVHNDQEFWIRYQVIFSRFFGRTGLYQSGGAFGFRDQLQDCLCFLDTNPKITLIHLIRCAAHQFEEGDVLHWWHVHRIGNSCDRGVRTRCSDDYLWLLFGVAEYIQATDDLSILEIPIPCLVGDPLNEKESERYFSPKKGQIISMREHLEKGIELFLQRGLGANMLPFIGNGDWNDGMNQIEGESVWLGFFSSICLNRCKNYVSLKLQHRIEEVIRKMSRGLSSAFNGKWFVRAFSSEGYIFGNDHSLQSECSIDLITQAFSAFYALEFYKTDVMITPDMIESALSNAFRILSDEKSRTTALFTKPFRDSVPSPGYIQRYCAGVRENGGQYTHAAVWFALALLEFGEHSENDGLIQMGMEVSKRLDPFANLDYQKFKRYQREPYVLCGDVYTASGHKGHGGWSWYTGAAKWYLDLIKKTEKFKTQNDTEK